MLSLFEMKNYPLSTKNGNIFFLQICRNIYVIDFIIPAPSVNR